MSFRTGAAKAVADAPAAVQRAFHKQLRFLADDVSHSSLRAKKYDATRDIWQAGVNRDWRFYFKIVSGTCYIVEMVPHPK